MLVIQTLPYILVLILASFVSKINKNRVVICWLIIILACFLGFRYGVGWDYYAYYELVMYADNLDNVAPIIKYLVLFAHNLHSPQLFFITTAFITIFLCVLTIYKLSKDIYISIFVFITYPLFYLNSFIIVKYFLAFSIIFYGSTFLLERRFGVFFVCLFLASQVHIASLIGIFYVLPLFLGNSNKVRILLLICSFALSPFVITLLYRLLDLSFLLERESSQLNLFARYIAGENSANFKSIPILYHAFNIFHLLFYNQLFNKNDKNASFYVSFMNIGCCLMQLFSFENNMSSRFSLPYIAYLIIIVSCYKNKSIANFVIVVLGVALFLYALLIKACFWEINIL